MTTSKEIGQRFLAALRADDFAAMGNCLTPAVRLRALLPRRTVDVAGRTEVMRLVAAGNTSREIGGQPFLSPRTVEMHVGRLLDKLDCGTRAEAVHKATTLGLLP
jgi:DNA-binding CsgD family transcriptional regulator